ncbi:MAG: cofactor-independent phosphoglycerate mutase, partial [candidate division WOR-3 bacterium]
MSKVKYVIIVPDGASDEPIEELGGKTPLEVARKENIDKLAQEGICGWVLNAPNGMYPGSDVCMLSILGVDPSQVYTGRAPIEAASMGIELGDNDVAYRCNLVRVENDIMIDYSAGHIDTERAKTLIEKLNREINEKNIKFYPGVSYRHIMIWQNGSDEAECTPPHDITGKTIKEYLPKGKFAELLISIMEKSKIILKNEDANMIWLWGQGKKPMLPDFNKMFGLRGAVISAVDLVKGIGKLMNMEVIEVPGATGYIDTNYKGKAEYAIRYLEKGGDFVLIHIEAPDEAGHNGDIEGKIKAIENIDKFIVGTILEWAENKSIKLRLLLLPDHPTPIKVRTHTHDVVPFVMWSNILKVRGEEGFSEKTLKYLKPMALKEGYKLINLFLG